MSVAERPRLTGVRGTVGILDDDPARVAAMRAVLAEQPDVDVASYADVEGFLMWAEACPTVLLLTLDHDLGASRTIDGTWRDPGIGMDVVHRLVELEPRVPVIVHSSNPIDAPRMAFLLEDAGWRVERVVPHSDTAWIGEDWAPVVQRLLEEDLRATPLTDQPEVGQATAVGALERITALHDRGALDDDEFRLAKQRLLGEGG